MPTIGSGSCRKVKPMCIENSPDIGRRAIANIVRSIDRRLITNSVRGIFVEHLVQAILGEPWVVTSEWEAWDLVDPEDRRIEVKQSAARQSWHAPDQMSGTRSPSFNVKASVGFYDGDVWVPRPGRHAHVYVFAWHPVTDAERADHRDASQWEFYVVRTGSLPVQSTITLNPLRQLADCVSFAGLTRAVNEAFAS